MSKDLWVRKSELKAMELGRAARKNATFADLDKFLDNRWQSVIERDPETTKSSFSSNSNRIVKPKLNSILKTLVANANFNNLQGKCLRSGHMLRKKMYVHVSIKQPKIVLYNTVTIRCKIKTIFQ